MSTALPWLQPGAPFPPASQAWGPADPAPGLLAAGGELDAQTLQRAYREGIFPWFSDDQPTLWWSPDPRMVLQVAHFRLHRSLKKTLARFVASPRNEIRFDTSFDRVMQACAASQRPGQSGTWILPPMLQAYQELHALGFAHSVETWIDGQLAGGLYCVALGRMVFGESMFSNATDASKIALSALVAYCRAHSIDWIDCQQNTGHLASLGAAPVMRDQFLAHVRSQVVQPPPVWRFQPLYWQLLRLRDGIVS